MIMSLRLVGLTFLILNVFALESSLNDEGLALLVFKQNINNSAAVGNLDNWNAFHANPCSWNGINCNSEDKVISIIIPNKRLQGVLRLDSGKLLALRRVNLRNNLFSGSLPPVLFNATELRVLVLSGNSFSGKVPDEIGNLKYLQSLDLSKNHFNGSLPSSLLQCGKLRNLNLSQNNFGGSIPNGFGTNLRMLQKLSLSCNRFSSLIPGDLGNLTSLQAMLDLSHNLFSGSIPDSLGYLPQFIYVNLAYNNLSGTIPQVGALVHASQTAFIGNPLLCGPPLKTECVDPPTPIEDDNMSRKSTRSQGKRSCIVIAATVSATMVGICLFVFLLTYWYKKVHVRRQVKHNDQGNSKEKSISGKEIFCFRTDELESLSENSEQFTFVRLDSQVKFDLEQLLKASAFLLGKSRNGMLYKVVLENGPTVVVRRLEDCPLSFGEFQTEVEAIGKIRHPNIVKLLAYCWCISEKLLIYQYVSGSNLATIIHGNTGTTYLKSLSWSIRLKIMKGIAEGLMFLHEFSPRRYVHGNLKPSNVLLDENMVPGISDFGLSSIANSTTEQSASVQSSDQITMGTPQHCSPNSLTPTANSSSYTSCYRAPEAAKSAKPSQKWDVYSFGVILLELISGRSSNLQIGSAEMGIVRWIQLSVEVKPLSYILDPLLTDDLDKHEEIVTVIKIALACVHGNPNKRPTMRTVSNSLPKLS